MTIRNHRDFWAGIMFLAFGLLFIGLSQQYTVGSAAKMGPGYFPTVLGAVMATLGAIVAVGGLSGKAALLRVEAFGWRPLALLLVAVLLFGFSLLRLGMVVSLVLLIGLSSVASHEFRLRDTIIATVVLIGIAWAVFVWGLELQFPVWPTLGSGR